MFLQKISFHHLISLISFLINNKFSSFNKSYQCSINNKCSSFNKSYQCSIAQCSIKYAENLLIAFAVISICSCASFQLRCSIASLIPGNVFTP